MNDQYRVVVLDSILGTLTAQAFFPTKAQAESFAQAKQLEGFKVIVEDLVVVGGEEQTETLGLVRN